jgi:chromosome segregation ATPase
MELKAKYDEVEAKLSNELAEKGVLENFKVSLEQKLKAEKDQIAELTKALENATAPASGRDANAGMSCCCVFINSLVRTCVLRLTLVVFFCFATGVSELEEANQQLSAEIDRLKADLQQNKEKLVQMQVKYEEELSKRTTLEKNASKPNGEVTQLKADKAKLEEQLKKEKEAVSKLEADLKKEQQLRKDAEAAAKNSGDANASQIKKEKETVSKLEAELKKEQQLRKDAEAAVKNSGDANASQLKDLQAEVKHLKEGKAKLEAELKKAAEEKSKVEKDAKAKGDTESSAFPSSHHHHHELENESFIVLCADLSCLSTETKKDLDAAVMKLKEAEQSLADEKTKRQALEKDLDAAKKNAQLQASADASREKTLNKEIADLKAKVTALDNSLKQKDKEYQTRLKQATSGVVRVPSLSLFFFPLSPSERLELTMFVSIPRMEIRQTCCIICTTG